MKELNIKVEEFLKEHEGTFELCRNDGYLDLDAVAKQFGIKVYEVNFTENGISGAISKDGADWTIYVNKDHHINRRRFTAAHEIGHYISYIAESHSKSYLEQYGSLTDTMYRKDGESNPMEIEANQIAASLLMPESIISDFIRRNVSVDEISNQLGVSMEAVSYRLMNFGYEIIL